MWCQRYSKQSVGSPGGEVANFDFFCCSFREIKQYLWKKNTLYLYCELYKGVTRVGSSAGQRVCPHGLGCDSLSSSCLQTWVPGPCWQVSCRSSSLVKCSGENPNPVGAVRTSARPSSPPLVVAFQPSCTHDSVSRLFRCSSPFCFSPCSEASPGHQPGLAPYGEGKDDKKGVKEQ